jgi:hypothetical protein
MLGLKRTTTAVTAAADAHTELANTARDVVIDVSAQVRPALQYLPLFVIGSGLIAVAALIIALVAITRD